jgi:hypothetical protein
MHFQPNIPADIYLEGSLIPPYLYDQVITLGVHG